jgi:hypothetical protein
MASHPGYAIFYCGQRDVTFLVPDGGPAKARELRTLWTTDARLRHEKFAAASNGARRAAGRCYEGQDRNDPRHVIHACSHKLRTPENARLRRRQGRGSLTTEYPSVCRSPTRQNAPPALLEGQLRKRPTHLARETPNQRIQRSWLRHFNGHVRTAGYIAGPERGTVRPRAAQDPRTGPSHGLGRARLRSGHSAVRRADA